MPLRTIKETESFTFLTAGELRDWLNMFKNTDLDTVYIEHGEANHLTFHREMEILSDGSKVFNIRLDK